MGAKIEKATSISTDRRGERGAALVTAMMISFLLLVACIALLLESSMNTANVTDATSEEQAYYAAESGIQSTLDALRHNPRPNPLLDATKLPYPPDPDAAEENQITYLRAVRRETSNATCTLSGSTVTCTDPLDAAPNATRLSRWLPYNWPSAATSKDRIVLGDPGSYSPINGFAYSVEVSDPDHTSDTIKYTVGYTVDGGVPQADGSVLRTFGSGLNKTDIKFTPPTGEQTVDISNGAGNQNIGAFRMTKTGTGGTIPDLDGLSDADGDLVKDQPVRFKIILTITQPSNAGYVVIRGYISPPGATLDGGPPPSTNPDCPRPTVAAGGVGVYYLFDSQGFLNFGSRQNINNTGCIVEESPSTHHGPYGTYLAGHLVNASASGTDQLLNMNFTQPQPRRLLVKSTGYGPRGARKQLETIIQRNYFDGLGAPSPITLIGPPCSNAAADTTGPPPCPGTLLDSTFLFDLSSSNQVFYTGKDKNLRMFQPPMGVTNDHNIDYLRLALESKADVVGTPSNVLYELPFWLQTPYNLDQAIQLWRAEADSSGNYWGPTSSPPTDGIYGDYATGTGLVVIDTDATMKDDGGGIVVVTGKLTINGNFKFKGIILVTGKGGIERKGNGTGEVAGAMIIAPYDAAGLACSGTPLTGTPQNTTLTNKCFMSPQFKVNGGGNSDTMGNSQAVASGLSGLGNFVKGVAEK